MIVTKYHNSNTYVLGMFHKRDAYVLAVIDFFQSFFSDYFWDIHLQFFNDIEKSKNNNKYHNESYKYERIEVFSQTEQGRKCVAYVWKDRNSENTTPHKKC